jgi:hypothetical protein
MLIKKKLKREEDIPGSGGEEELRRGEKERKKWMLMFFTQGVKKIKKRRSVYCEMRDFISWDILPVVLLTYN